MSLTYAPLGPGMIRAAPLWWQFFKGGFAARDRDVIVVSYPKSGRTWHRVILAKYLEALYGLKDGRSIGTRKLTQSLGLPVVSYSHNGAGSRYAIGPRHFLNASPLLWRSHRIILLVRDPRDVLVSGYFHDRYRTGSFTGSLSDYIRHPYTGIEKLLVAHQRWFSYSRKAPAFLLQRYESFHADPEAAVAEMLEFIGIDIDWDAISTAIEFARFENMQRLELDGHFNSDAMRIEGPSEEARKVREGKVGGYLKHMTADDIAYVESMILQMGYPY